MLWNRQLKSVQLSDLQLRVVSVKVVSYRGGLAGYLRDICTLLEIGTQDLHINYSSFEHIF